MISVECLLNIQTVIFYGVFFLLGMVLKFLPPQKTLWYGRRKESHKPISNKVISKTQNLVSNYMMIGSLSLMIISLLIKYFTDYNYSAISLYSIIDILLLITGTVMIYFIVDDKIKKVKKKHS